MRKEKECARIAAEKKIEEEVHYSYIHPRGPFTLIHTVYIVRIIAVTDYNCEKSNGCHLNGLSM